jgi:hypothetical protein
MHLVAALVNQHPQQQQFEWMMIGFGNFFHWVLVHWLTILGYCSLYI